MEKKFKDIIKDCEKMIDECGFELPRIEFKLNNKFTTTLGQCRKFDTKDYMIVISKKYAQGCIETGNIRKLEQTILHEMAHALPNGFNHGKVWKTYVNIINGKFEYEISRLATVPNEVRQYWIKDGVRVCCDTCGEDRLTKRSADIVKNIRYYRCSCGGKLSVKEVI